MNRTTIGLIVLLVVLGLVSYFYIFAPSGKEREASYTAGDVAFKFDSAAITRIEIHHAGKTVGLENKGGTWAITQPASYKANQASINQLLGGISHFKVGSLVSSNPAKQATFEVDSATGTVLTVSDRSNKTSKIIVGKPGPSYSDFYFRADGGKDVYLGEGITPYVLNQDVREWRDKTIYHTLAETLLTIRYEVNGQTYQLVKDTASWRLGDGPIANEVAQSVTNNLANLNAEDFVDTVPKLELAPVVVHAGNNNPTEIKFYPQPPDSSKWIVQAAGNPQVYTVGKWTVQQILKPVEAKLGGGKKKR